MSKAEHKPLFPLPFAQLFLILPLAALLFPFVRRFQCASEQAVSSRLLAGILAIALSLGFLSPYFWFQVRFRKRFLQSGNPDAVERVSTADEITFFSRLCFRGLVLGLIAFCVLIFYSKCPNGF